MADSGNSEMIERVARAICKSEGYDPDYEGQHGVSWKEFSDHARAAIEAMMAGQFVEYRITSPDGELFAETAGTPAAAFAEAQHYAMQEPGAVIEQVVCLPALSPSLKEQERT